MALEAGLDTGPVYARVAHADRRRRDRGRAAGAARRARHRPAASTRCPRIADDHARAAGRRAHLRRQAHRRGVRARLGRGPPAELARVVRAGNPRPGAWTTVDGTRLKVWRARPLSAGIDGRPAPCSRHSRVATGDGALELVEVQPEGRRAMPADAWLAGRRRRAAARYVSRRDDAPAASRSTRSCASRTARTRTSCCPAMLRAVRPRRPRPRLRHRPRVRHRARATPARRPPRAASSKRPLDRLDPPVRAALRLGAYQLLHDVAAARRGGETVDALGGALAARPRLRERACCARSRGSAPPWPEPVERRGRALVPRLDRRAPRPRARRRRRARAALVAMNEPAAVTLRPEPAPGHRRRARRRAARRRRRGRARARSCPTRSSCAASATPAALPAVRDGRATPQDQGEPGRGRACSTRSRASGSPTSPPRPAARRPRSPSGSGDDGAVVAARRRRRARAPRSTRRRAPPRPAARVRRVVADGRALAAARRRASTACCSTRRAPASACCAAAPTPAGACSPRRDRRARRAPARPARAPRRALVRPGGVLVYSVCTLTRAETIDVDDWAAAAPRPASTRSPPPGRARGARTAAARSCSRRPPAPTACSSSPSPAPMRFVNNRHSSLVWVLLPVARERMAVRRRNDGSR